jgi:hypothetical protein
MRICIPVMKFSMLVSEHHFNAELETVGEGATHFIQPPRPAPRRMTSLPSLSTIFVPETFRIVGGMLQNGARRRRERAERQPSMIGRT